MIMIPVYQPSLNGNEKKYVLECLESTWISSKGKFIPEFEYKFAKYVGAKHATAVCNGTTALHLSLLALGIGPGDEVIIPTLTYIASANSIVYTGATPIFADSDKETWQIDPNDVKNKITSRTKAIMVVHLYGHPCDMDQLVKIAKEHYLFLIEDCAEAIGSLYKGQYVGTFGDIAAFSFFGNKTITTGEGGMVVTNDETLFNRVVHFKGQGLAKYREYWHDVIGYNFRMTNICAAIGLAQLEQIDNFIKKKRALAHSYKEKIKNLPITLHQEIGDVRHSYWMCSLLVNNSKNRDPLRKILSEAGIETRPLFYPIHTMPMYSQKYQKHPVAENLGWRGINLPSWPGLQQEQIDFICKKIIDYFEEKHDR
jgi:perosamine synthetase